MADRIALVAGANGIIGKALMEELGRSAAGWQVRALGRRPFAGQQSVSCDLLDGPATVAALAGAADTTHLFYAALTPGRDLADEDARNGAMLRNVLDGLEDAGAPLRRVVLYQGAKIYGVHLGPVASPFYEDDNPPHLGPNFYQTQEAELARRFAADPGRYAILRPDVVIGDAAGNPMNIATVIGAYAALCRATGAAFRFPGTETVYRHVFAQMTDAHALGRASLWAADAAAAGGQAFNYVHEPFRWERIWTKVGAALGLEVAPPMPMTLAKHMADQGAVWAKLVADHGLRDTPYDKLVGWGFGDFIFNCAFDVVSDMGKIRAAGFSETVDSADAIIAAIRSLQARKVLP
jgi:nucleoside-diphosphate-sugar epimerase